MIDSKKKKKKMWLSVLRIELSLHAHTPGLPSAVAGI